MQITGTSLNQILYISKICMIPYFGSRIYRRQNFSRQKISNNNNNLWTLSQAHFIFMIYFNYTCIMHSTFDCFISFQMSSNDGIETLVMTSPNASVQENGNSHPVTHEVPLDIKTVPPVEVPPIPASPPKVESSVSVDETQNEVKPVPPSSSVLPINTKPASEILTHAEEKQRENNVHEVQEKEKSNEGDVAEEKKIQKEEIEKRREAELRITVEERKEDEERKETKERKEDKEHKEDEERKQKDEEHKEVKERKQENEEEKQDEERKQEDEKREEDERKEDEEIREEDEGRKDVEVVSSPRKRKKRQYSIKELNNSSAEKREFVFYILKNKIEKLLFVI